MDAQTQGRILKMVQDSGGEMTFDKGIMDGRMVEMLAEMAAHGLLARVREDTLAVTYRLAEPPP